MVRELRNQRILRALKLVNVMGFRVTHPFTRAAPGSVFCDALSNGYRYSVAQYTIGFASLLRIE
jgi:hypothetical protein